MVSYMVKMMQLKLLSLRSLDMKKLQVQLMILTLENQHTLLNFMITLSYYRYPMKNACY